MILTKDIHVIDVDSEVVVGGVLGGEVLRQGLTVFHVSNI
jgi:hypothetical protein